MHVALYARYSSEHQREASIADQFRNVNDACQGWTIIAAMRQGHTGSRGRPSPLQRLLQVPRSTARRPSRDVFLSRQDAG